jgi:hypothetical protein
MEIYDTAPSPKPVGYKLPKNGRDRLTLVRVQGELKSTSRLWRRLPYRLSVALDLVVTFMSF